MMQIQRFGTVALALLVLSACGGGGATLEAQRDTLGQLNAREDYFESRLNAANPIAVPTSGNATYIGDMVITQSTGGNGEFLNGLATLNVNFEGAGGVTGSATDFVYASGSEAADAPLSTVAGTLTIENGALDRSGADSTQQMTADITGTLTWPDTIDIFGIEDGSTVDIDADLTGQFFQDLLSVTGSGTADQDPGLDPTADISVSIIAIR